MEKTIDTTVMLCRLIVKYRNTNLCVRMYGTGILALPLSIIPAAHGAMLGLAWIGSQCEEQKSGDISRIDPVGLCLTKTQ